MSRALRVVHLPARTPYVKKIVSADFTMLNGASTQYGIVPDAVTASWLLDRRPFNWFDVLHLHHIEFDDIGTLEYLLAACQDDEVRIAYTAHDINPMFGTTEDFNSRLTLLANANVAWICLTAASMAALTGRLGTTLKVTVIPHGYVASPDDIAGNNRAWRTTAPHYLLYGALRRNRDHLSTIANWSLSIKDHDAQLELLLRAFSPADFEHYDVPALLAMIRSDPRIRASMRAHTSDQEIVAAGLSADVLLLPYLFGSHSGQLELAFDLNLVPVCSSVGFLREQYLMHEGLVGEPVWFDWTNGHPFLFGEKFVTALEAAHARLARRPRQDPSAAFLDYRREEHQRFLTAHAEVYSQ